MLELIKMESSHDCSVIIPAFNESQRILQVLKVIKLVAFFKEVVIIDDGSSDDTVSVIQSFMPQDERIKLLCHLHNLGKGQAIRTAASTVTSEYILMLDADLINLNPDHIQQLCEPVFSGMCNMTLGLFKGGDWKTDFSHWATPWLSGQRCISRELLSRISWDAAAGYGLETALTVAAHQYHWKVQRVTLRGMSHPVSEIHRGGFKGFMHRMKMYSQILRAWYIALKPNPEKASRKTIFWSKR